ncbi:hypothetical protein C4J81_07915 [Deltaproteobacteria bacterium Smac51]|nr:hypothetical protein C4J81_07915 [Deltaproteobacteria bacterium Smac51]
MIKTAMLLAAGFGQRLRPLTLVRPKPLFHVLNKTMLEWWAEFLSSAGVERIVINAHYMAPMMLEYIDKLAVSFKNKLEIIPSLEEELMGTGGGLKKAAPLLNADNFLVINADIFSDFELVKISRQHLSAPGRLATLGLLENIGPANVSVGEEGRILAFRQPEKVEGELGRRTYCGVMAMSSEIFELIPPGFSDIIKVFSEAMDEGAEIHGWTYDPAIWQDMGTIGDYWRLNETLAAGRTIIHSTAKVEGKLSGWNVIGAQAVIEKGADVENCVIWPGSVVAAGASLKKAVISGAIPEDHKIDGGFFCDVPGC